MDYPQPDPSLDPEAAAPVETPAAPAPAPIGVPAAELIQSLQNLGEVEVQVRVELGRRSMTINEALRLTPGAIIPLERQADAPLDLFINDHLVARGEVVVVENEFALRLSEFSAPEGEA